MDPDGLSILIATASTFGALAAAYRAGAVSASEPERQQSGILGFSDRMAGLCAAFVFACGFFVYGFLRIFAQAPWWTLLCLAALAALAVLLYSLGRAKGRIKEKSGFTAACMLGAPLAAPAKLVFKALGLSAQSDVTEEDVLSFVDDVEELDLIDESQKKMITNIFELDDVTAGDVMTHRTEVSGVEVDVTLDEVARLAVEDGDRKRGGKHARRRRGTPFSGARIFAPPGRPQVTGRHCRHFVCEGPVRALGHAGKGAGPGEPVHARRDVRAGSLPRPGAAGGF